MPNEAQPLGNANRHDHSHTDEPVRALTSVYPRGEMEVVTETITLSAALGAMLLLPILATLATRIV